MDTIILSLCALSLGALLLLSYLNCVALWPCSSIAVWSSCESHIISSWYRSLPQTSSFIEDWNELLCAFCVMDTVERLSIDEWRASPISSTRCWGLGFWTLIFMENSSAPASLVYVLFWSPSLFEVLLFFHSLLGEEREKFRTQRLNNNNKKCFVLSLTEILPDTGQWVYLIRLGALYHQRRF